MSSSPSTMVPPACTVANVRRFLQEFRQELSSQEERRRVLQEGVLLDAVLSSLPALHQGEAVPVTPEEEDRRKAVEVGLFLWQEGYLPSSLRRLATSSLVSYRTGDLRLMDLIDALSHEERRGHALSPSLRTLHRHVVLTAWEETHLTGRSVRPLPLSSAPPPQEGKTPPPSEVRRLQVAKEEEIKTLLPSLPSSLVERGAREWVAGSTLRGRMLASSFTWRGEEGREVLLLLLTGTPQDLIALPKGPESFKAGEAERRGRLDAPGKFSYEKGKSVAEAASLLQPFSHESPEGRREMYDAMMEEVRRMKDPREKTLAVAEYASTMAQGADAGQLSSMREENAALLKEKEAVLKDLPQGSAAYLKAQDEVHTLQASGEYLKTLQEGRAKDTTPEARVHRGVMEFQERYDAASTLSPEARDKAVSREAGRLGAYTSAEDLAKLEAEEEEQLSMHSSMTRGFYEDSQDRSYSLEDREEFAENHRVATQELEARRAHLEAVKTARVIAALKTPAKEDKSGPQDVGYSSNNAGWSPAVQQAFKEQDLGKLKKFYEKDEEELSAHRSMMRGFLEDSRDSTYSQEDRVEFRNSYEAARVEEQERIYHLKALKVFLEDGED